MQNVNSHYLVVFYEPDLEIVTNHISFSQKFQEVTFWFNSAVPTEARDLLTRLNIQVIECLENPGIKSALMYVAEQTVCKTVFYIDQDTTIINVTEFPSTINQALSEHFLVKYNKYCTSYSKILHEFIMLNSTTIFASDFLLMTLKEIHEKALKLDGIDHFIQFYCITNNIEMHTYSLPVLHELGSRKCVSILGRKYYTSTYNSQRMTSQRRASVYLMFRFIGVFPVPRLLLLSFVKREVKYWLFR